MTKVYVVRYGEYSGQGIAGVFSSKERAEFYCKIQNEIENCYIEDYWVDEYILDEDVYPEDTKVATYYGAAIYLEDCWSYDKKTLYGKKGEFVYGDDEEDYPEEKRVYTKDTIIRIQDSDEYTYKEVEVYSIKGLEHAKKVALDEYYKYMAKKEGIS